MSSHRAAPSTSARRCGLVPPSTAGELLRLRLIEVLARRWDVAVTTVVAGAGLGKSTALAQAIRHHHAHPRGVEAWVSCEAGDEDADHLADAIVRALGAPRAGADAVGAVVNALRSTSPLAVCLVVDDVHELPARSSAVQLLADVVRALPAHAHLVLAGRTMPALPLARLRAAQQVLDVTQESLAFTAAEVVAVASAGGHDAPDLTHLQALGGWPALVRLAVGSPASPASPGSPGSTGATGRCADLVRCGQFVWEEVVSRLRPADLRALLALATMGTADATTLTSLCGAPVDVDELVRAVPMVGHTGDGRVRAHDLWHGTLTSIVPEADVRAVGRASAELLLADGAYLRAGSLAARLGDTDIVCRAALALVRNTLSALPVDTAAAWLRSVPTHHRRRPELRLLEAAVLHARGDHDPEVDALITEALGAFRAAADDVGEQTALGLRLVLAHTRGDAAAALGLVDEAARLPGLGQDRTLRVLAPMVEAIGAHLVGDVERGAAVLDTLSVDDGLPPVIAEAIVRFHWHLLVFSGRAEDAARLAPRVLAAAATPNAPLFRPVARWLAGDPTGFDGMTPDGLLEHEARTPSGGWENGRDWFNYGVFTAMVWGSSGDREVVGRVLQLVRSLDLDPDTGRNGGPLAVIAAVDAVLAHDDARAVELVTAFVERFPLTDRFTDICLRRFLAVPYVCSAAARQRWDGAALGPAQIRHREVARALLAARDGSFTARRALPAPAEVFTALPLPWAVELAARADAAGHDGGATLAQWLVDRLGPVAHDEVRRLTGAREPAVARAARRLLGAIALPPAETTRVELLGPTRLLVDGEVVERPELRRARVRELLAVLAIQPTLGRERAMDLLWPDLGPADAARNLRVTLTHLRRCLEPGRERGDQGYHVRADGDQVRLVPSERLVVDVWELHDHLRAAAVARTAGDVAEQIIHLGHVVALWRGDPLRDLERVPELLAEAQHLQLRLVDAALTLGELRLAGGDGLAAASCAERALTADPYDERALRLLIAGHLSRGDRAATSDACRRTRDVLDDLGVEPDERTVILLRQAGVHELASR
ncbi:MAG: BTAD domain-containing putative transcriptional regulator [Ilumatobacteraceae bacterium]